ncbi:MAG: SUMF1/EgtB/PvdO family nonheme iron enzyme, partial [Planctomycetota bacterium]
MNKHEYLQTMKLLQKQLPELLAWENGELIYLPDQSPMVYVPSNDYIIGAHPDHLFAQSYEKPELKIKLSGFLIDKFPVTVKRYQEFMYHNGYQNLEFWSENGKDFLKQNVIAPLMWDERLFQKDNYPVAGVSYYEAEAYATWSQKLLPTEAQWEISARGRTIYGPDREFPWGDAFPGKSRLNFNGEFGHVTSVDRYPSGISAFGLYDMAGNVNNWCRDWFLVDYLTYFKQGHLNPEVNPQVREILEEQRGILLNKKSDRGGGFLTKQDSWPALLC